MRLALCINYCTVDAEYIEATSIDPVTADAVVSTCAFILVGRFLPILLLRSYHLKRRAIRTATKCT